MISVFLKQQMYYIVYFTIFGLIRNNQLNYLVVRNLVKNYYLSYTFQRGQSECGGAEEKLPRVD